MRLAKTGYYGGNPEAVLNAPLDIVLRAIEYEGFEKDYAECYQQLNLPEK